MPMWLHISSRNASTLGGAAPTSGAGEASERALGSGAAPAEPGAPSMRSTARCANTTVSSRELDARRFAPCTPVQATSPTA